MPMLEPGRTALITGASSGIGRAFALELGRRGLRVVLVARTQTRLEELAREIDPSGERAQVLVADLAVSEDLARVEERLREGPPVDLFVNNAALGVSGRFVDVDVEAAELQIRVNVLAATRLAHAALSGMRARGAGGLIQVSSGAHFVPSVYNAAYSGTKSYLATFSLTIAEELRNEGIDVVTVFPGFTRTEFQQRAHFDVQGVPGFLWQPAEAVVREALAAYTSGRSFCVPGAHNKLAVALMHLVPHSLLGRVAGLVARMASQRQAERVGA